MLLPALNSAREKARRISCASNLKQLGTSFQLYITADDGTLPLNCAKDEIGTNEDGTASLELLRAGGHLIDHKIYQCPSSSSVKQYSNKASNLTDNKDGVSYAYLPGFDTSMPSDSGIAADGVDTDGKISNHTDFGNILFIDGHVGSGTTINGTTPIYWIGKANWTGAVKLGDKPYQQSASWQNAAAGKLGPVKAAAAAASNQD